MILFESHSRAHVAEPRPTNPILHSDPRLSFLRHTVLNTQCEAQFPNANEVIFERTPNRHLAFAAGPHRCVGSHLARLEMKIVHEHMHRRVPNYRLEPGAEINRHASSVAGLDVVPLVWD